jgi:hypothetical protein
VRENQSEGAWRGFAFSTHKKKKRSGGGGRRESERERERERPLCRLLLRLEFALSRWDEIAFLVRIHDTCKLEVFHSGPFHYVLFWKSSENLLLWLLLLLPPGASVAVVVVKLKRETESYCDSECRSVVWKSRRNRYR